MVENWFDIDVNYRNRFKNNVFSSFSLENSIMCSFSAEIVAEILAVDDWAEVLPFLLSQVLQQNSLVDKLVRLDAITCICTKIAPADDVLHVLIITAETKMDLRRRAVKCLARIASAYSELSSLISNGF